MTITSRKARQRARVGAAIATLTLPALLVVCPASAQTTNLSIATGGTGGVYYPLGGGIATEIRENVEGYDATVQ